MKPASSCRRSIETASEVFGDLTGRWSRRAQRLMVSGRGFPGLGGAGLTVFRSPNAKYLLFGGVIWMLLWTAYLANAMLRDPGFRVRS